MFQLEHFESRKSFAIKYIHILGFTRFPEMGNRKLLADPAPKGTLIANSSYGVPEGIP